MNTVPSGAPKTPTFSFDLPSVSRGFTEGSQTAFAMAEQEARRFSHHHIGTEHLLVGLARQDSGIAACVLAGFDIDFRRLRIEVTNLIQLEPADQLPVRYPITLRLRRAIESSATEAEELGHQYIGTEHLLLGLVNDPDSMACQVLMNCGVKPEEIRGEVHFILDSTRAKSHKIADLCWDISQLKGWTPCEVWEKAEKTTSILALSDPFEALVFIYESARVVARLQQTNQQQV